MTVRAEAKTIYLEGVCSVEEAETLTTLLAEPDAWTVDLALCRQLHGAVVQVLLRFQPQTVGVSQTPFIRDMLVPALSSACPISARAAQ